MASQTILELKNIVKAFPGVKALNNVCFSLFQGEVHALVGANGAGKTTLVRIITRELKEDEGKIYFLGKNLKKADVKEARKLGIGIVEQEINLVPFFSVAENILLGGLSSKLLFVEKKDLLKKASELLCKTGKDIDARKKVEELSPSEQVYVALARALSVNPKLLILDEPTARMGLVDTEILFQTLSNLKRQGVSIIYISHRLEEIYKIADRVTVLRNGENVLTASISEITPGDIVKAILGRKQEEHLVKKQEVPAVGKTHPLLTVRNLSGERFKDVSFQLYPGEVVGLVGMVGAGKTELLNAIIGREKRLSGEVFIEGRKIMSPYQAVKAGIGIVPEDRKVEGIVENASVCENITLPTIENFQRFGLIKFTRERKHCFKAIERFNIQTPSPRQKIKFLSGGNQQKVIVSRWFLSNMKVLICDEASQGMDVGAKFEIYNFIKQFARNGGAVLYSTSDIPEALRVCDRLLVMYNGRIVKRYDSLEEADLNEIMLYAMGGKGGNR